MVGSSLRSRSRSGGSDVLDRASADIVGEMRGVGESAGLTESAYRRLGG